MLVERCRAAPTGAGPRSASAESLAAATESATATAAVAASGAALAAAWDAGGAIELSASRDSGKTWTRPQQLAEVDATHPRIVPTASGFLVLWTQREAGVSVLKTRAVAR